MANALWQIKDETLAITDHAALILSQSRRLLQAGMATANGAARIKLGRFDVTSLRYERAKDELLDAIQLARLYEYRDVPFFLSHQAIMAVHKRISQNGKANDKYRKLLLNANHQVFICEVEDLLDRASNHNFEAAQSKRGYSGDKAEIIMKLHKVIADYGRSQQQLGGSLPAEISVARAQQMLAGITARRKLETTKEALKLANWSLHRIEGDFALGRILLPLDMQKQPDAVVFLMAVNGRLSLVSDAWRGPVAPIKFRTTAGHKTESVILAKFLVRELWAEMDAGHDILNVLIEAGTMQLRWRESPGLQIHAASGRADGAAATLRIGS